MEAPTPSPPKRSGSKPRKHPTIHSGQTRLAQLLDLAERNILVDLLDFHRGSRQALAAYCQVADKTITRLLTKHGLAERAAELRREAAAARPKRRKRRKRKEATP